MIVKKLKTSEIFPYENNPRDNRLAIPLVKESIKQVGYIKPIIVDEDHVILAGHSRFEALKELGQTEIECLICEGLDEQTKKKYRYLDNKTGEKATWDIIKLEIELAGLDTGEIHFLGEDEKEEPEETREKTIGSNYEYSAEDFDDEKFRFTCPKCGFKFN